MGIRKYSLFIVIFVFTVSLVGATPPSSVNLKYDLEKQTLYIEAAHVSENLDRHYLRRIVIYKNDIQVDAITLTRQKIPTGIEEDVKVSAQGGDKLSAEVFCKKGGVARGEMTVPIPPKEDDKKEENKNETGF